MEQKKDFLKAGVSVLILIGLFFQIINICLVPLASATVDTSDWQYCKKIIIDHTKVPNSLTNFPVLFDNTSADYTHAQADGDDFMFLDAANNTKYQHEIESFASNRLVAWVNVTYVSSVSDTVIWLYYGNVGCSNQQQVTSVWSRYKIVQHLKDLTTSTTNDSTSNNYDGVKKAANNPLEATGRVWKSEDFDNVDDAINVTSTVHGAGAKTITFWLYSEVDTDTQVFFGTGTDISSGDNGWGARTNDGTTMVVWLGNGATSGYYLDTASTLRHGVWQYWCIVYNGVNLTTYYNGTGAVVDAGKSGSETAPDKFLCMGRSNNPSYYYVLNGNLDEFRVMNGTRNVSWFVTEYNNQNSPSTFLSVSAEIANPSYVPPVIIPSAPLFFQARTQSSSWIQLNWTKGTTGVDKTVIIANNTEYPTLSDCIVIYNGTGSWFNHTGLTNNTHWFYRCYSWNDTSTGCYNTTFLQDHDTTMGIPISSINLDLHNTTGSYTVEYDNDSYSIYIEDANYTELPVNSYDGDWDTFGILIDDVSYDIHYTKPTEAIGAIWWVKDTEGNHNFTLSVSDFAQHLSFVHFNIDTTDEDETNEIFYECGGTLFYHNASTTDFNFYEEGIIWLSEGYIINFTSESQLNITENLVDCTGSYSTIWNSPFWDILFNATGNTTSLVWENHHVDTTWSHVTQLLDNNSWYIYDNDTGVSPNIHMLVHNPNPGNGTHSTNYLRNDTGGLTTSVDVSYINFTTPPALIPGTYSLECDSYNYGGPTLQNNSGVYNDVWVNTSGQVIPGNLYTGQLENAGDYFIERGYLIFNTTLLPDEAVVDSAYVQLVVYEDDGVELDFNVTIQQVKSPAPHNPLVPGDYNKANFPPSATYGNRNITGLVDDDWFNISINASGLADINKAGFTNWVLRSDQDIQGDAPGVGVDEWIGFYGPGGVAPLKAPHLIVNYTIPSSNWQRIVNLSWCSNSSGVWVEYYSCHVVGNGTVTVPNVNFTGNTTYYWNVSWESNNTNVGVSQVYVFETVNTGTEGGTSAVIPLTTRSPLIPMLLTSIGLFYMGLIFFNRRKKKG